MQKNSFIQGAFIASLGIFICKILGILYVIPFYAIVGAQGGALYGYAYTFYDMFTQIATVGLPFAISKVVSEYNTLGYFHKKEEIFKIGLKLVLVLSTICFAILFILAPQFAYNIIGEAKGGNTIEDITTVIRVSSLSLVFVSILSLTKGYLQGHKFITVSSISQILEQIIRITVIIVGSYLGMNVFKIGLAPTVSIAVFGACAGAIAALLYLVYKIKNNNELKYKEYKETKQEKSITDKEMLKKLIYYAIPFMMIALMTSAYSMIDMFTVGPTLRGLGYTTPQSEEILGNITTWGSKLLSIIQAVVSGLCVSLIPNISASFASKDMDDVEDKINKTYLMTLYLTMPMALGLSFLAKPVWEVFYGVTAYGPSVFKLLIIMSIPSSIFLVSMIILQALNKHKEVFLALLANLIINLVLNIPLMQNCPKIGIPAYYGPIIASILGYISSIIITIITLKKQFKFNLSETYKKGITIILDNLIMIASLTILNIFINKNVDGRFASIIIIIIYAVVGASIYAFITNKNGLMQDILGYRADKLLNKLKIKRKNK